VGKSTFGKHKHTNLCSWIHTVCKFVCLCLCVCSADQISGSDPLSTYINTNTQTYTLCKSMNTSLCVRVYTAYCVYVYLSFPKRTSLLLYCTYSICTCTVRRRVAPSPWNLAHSHAHTHKLQYCMWQKVALTLTNPSLSNKRTLNVPTLDTFTLHTARARLLSGSAPSPSSPHPGLTAIFRYSRRQVVANSRRSNGPRRSLSQC
jgi:hypothetical protein